MWSWCLLYILLLKKWKYGGGPLIPGLYIPFLSWRGGKLISWSRQHGCSVAVHCSGIWGHASPGNFHNFRCSEACTNISTMQAGRARTADWSCDCALFEIWKLPVNSSWEDPINPSADQCFQSYTWGMHTGSDPCWGWWVWLVKLANSIRPAVSTVSKWMQGSPGVGTVVPLAPMLGMALDTYSMVSRYSLRSPSSYLSFHLSLT